MRITYPSYYCHFQCIAAACPDSCCKEWEVDVDPKTTAYYLGLPGPLGDDLRRVLRETEDGSTMKIQNGRCPMWREDGLCRIQAELGHEALCATCREFPRLRHDYGSFLELGLELSCPEAARMILSWDGELITEHADGGDAPEYDMEAMQILLKSREVALDYLDTSTLPVSEQLAVILLYAHHVQNWLDGGEEPSLSEHEALLLMEQHATNGDWSGLVSFFRELEILTPRWRSMLDQPEGAEAWDEKQNALIRYFILRHWLQAVSDYDLIGRAKFVVAACLLIRYLGGDIVETAQLFSKEIENDSDNLEAILDGAYTSPALTDLNLLSLLKNG